MRNVKVELNEAIKHLQAARFEVLKNEHGLALSERLRKLELNIYEEMNILDNETGGIVKFPVAARTQ